ncbi:Gp49 family protein, partial [Escherichia coli]
MNDQQIEKEIVEKGKTEPRITPQHIEDVIKSEHYFTAYDGRNGAISSNEYCGREKPEEGDRDLSPLKLLTFCVLVLKNGFTVTG